MTPDSTTKIASYTLRSRDVAKSAGIPVQEDDLVSITTDDGYTLKVTVRTNTYNRKEAGK